MLSEMTTVVSCDVMSGDNTSVLGSPYDYEDADGYHLPMSPHDDPEDKLQDADLQSKRSRDRRKQLKPVRMSASDDEEDESSDVKIDQNKKESERFQCDLCEDNFESSRAVEEHIIKRHSLNAMYYGEEKKENDNKSSLQSSPMNLVASASKYFPNLVGLPHNSMNSVLNAGRMSHDAYFARLQSIVDEEALMNANDHNRPLEAGEKRRYNASPGSGEARSNIFHQDAYCELCDREFCNKYFLKTHKANKHGIYDFSVDFSPTQSIINQQDLSKSPLNSISPRSPIFNNNNDTNKSKSEEHSPEIKRVKSEAAPSSVWSEKSYASSIDALKDMAALRSIGSNMPSMSAPDFRAMANLSLINPFNSPFSFMSPFGSLSKMPMPPMHMKTSSSIDDSSSSSSANIKPLDSFNGNALLDLYNRKLLAATNQFNNSPFFPKPEMMLRPTGCDSMGFGLKGSDHNFNLPSGFDFKSLEECEICHKKFPNKQSLSMHIGTVHGGKSEMDVLCTMSHDPMMNGSIDDFGSRIIDRVQCDICGKEVCNKYFLKTHKIKVHNCDPSTLDSSPIEMERERNQHNNKQVLPTPNNQITSSPCPPRNNVIPTEQQNQQLPDHPRDEELLQMGIDPEAYCEICKKEFCNKYFLKTHKQNIHGIRTGNITSTTSSNNLITEEVKYTPERTSSNMMNVPVTPSWCGPFPPTLPAFGMMNGPGVPNGFMATHLGILARAAAVAAAVGSLPHSSNPLSLFSNPMITNPMISNAPSLLGLPPPNLGPPNINCVGLGNSSDGDANSDKRSSWKWKEPVNAMRVMCEICNKVLCNKYFLKTHMAKRHGLNYDTVTGQLTNSQPISPQQSSNNSQRETASPPLSTTPTPVRKRPYDDDDYDDDADGGDRSSNDLSSSRNDEAIDFRKVINVDNDNNSEFGSGCSESAAAIISSKTWKVPPSPTNMRASDASPSPVSSALPSHSAMPNLLPYLRHNHVADPFITNNNNNNVKSEMLIDRSQGTFPLPSTSMAINYKKEKSTDCDSALIPLLCVHG